MRFLSRTPVRTFLIYPLVVLLWELLTQAGRIEVNLWGLPLMIWGYLQYRLCGKYRSTCGGGGPGPEVPAERLVSTGLYAYSRNPMYLGHLIFLTGLSLTLKSWFAAVITLAVAIWFHFRVLADEASLARQLGAPYLAYTSVLSAGSRGCFELAFLFRIAVGLSVSKNSKAETHNILIRHRLGDDSPPIEHPQPGSL